MSIISEIESIQLKIKDFLNKTLKVNTPEQIQDVMSSDEFKDYFQKFEAEKWDPHFYQQLKFELTKAEKKDSFIENAELSKILKTIYAERFFSK